MEEIAQGTRKDNVPPARLGRFAPALLGCPIPIVHCSTCGVVPVPKDRFPSVCPMT